MEQFLRNVVAGALRTIMLVSFGISLTLGSSGAVRAETGTKLVVEFYNAALDHYFLTHDDYEIMNLDFAISVQGWERTGEMWTVFTTPLTGTSPVCRYYIPPHQGDSHFYGRGVAECEATAAANPSFVNESWSFFHAALPLHGSCPPGSRNLYRVFSNRVDANHRYTTERAIRDQMVADGWLAEGDGDDRVVMCVVL